MVFYIGKEAVKEIGNVNSKTLTQDQLDKTYKMTLKEQLLCAQSNIVQGIGIGVLGACSCVAVGLTIACLVEKCKTKKLLKKVGQK